MKQDFTWDTGDEPLKENSFLSKIQNYTVMQYIDVRVYALIYALLFEQN